MNYVLMAGGVGGNNIIPGLLTANQGSFTLSGQDANLKYNHLIASQGSFTISGQAVGLRCARGITAAQGSFTLAGQSATLTYSNSYLLYDTFTGTNGTNLTAHTMDVGSGWTADSNSMTISGNAAVAGGTPVTHYSANSGQGDVSVSCTVNLTANDYGGVKYRGSDGSNWLSAVFRTTIFGIVDSSAGSLSFLTTVSSTFSTSTNYTLTVLARDTHVVACVNGVYVTWITTLHQTSTRCGLYADLAHTFDDFKVISAPAQTTYASDDGDDANGTNLSGKSTDTGQTWTVHSGTWETDSGNIRQTTTTGGYHRATFDAGYADFVLEIPFTIGTAGHNFAGILLRYTDSTHHWMAWYDDAATDNIALYECNGSFTNRASANVTLNSGTTYTFKIVAAGKSISVAVLDGSTVLAVCAYHAATTEQTTTRVGFVDFRDATYNVQPLYQSITVRSL